MIPRIKTYPLEPPDCRDVVAAAAALRLREFDFFRLAYRRWFGRQPDEKTLEKVFVVYMFRQVVPPWVRHISREVLDRRKAGMLDAQAFGAERYRDRPSGHPRGKLYFVAAIAVWAALFSLLLATRYDLRTSAPLPDCVGKSGSAFYESWARMISGNPLPPCQDEDIVRQ